jgi:hypothetical protein
MMKPTDATGLGRGQRHARLSAASLTIVLTVAACGAGVAGSVSTSGVTTTPSPGVTTTVAPTPTTSPGATTTNSSSIVLPVTDNPIKNSATAQTLKIDSVLVENNVDAAGKDTSDHLEISLTNTGDIELSGFEVFYTFTDTIANTAESYYFRLPDSFTIPAGGSRIAHFDNTGETDHFPVNEFSLYYTSTNALAVTVMVSASGAAPQTAQVQKDAGGSETSD